MTAPLSAHSPIGDWLAHPKEAPAIGALLEQAGVHPDASEPLRTLPLEKIVLITRGNVPHSVIDDLVRQI